MTEAFKAIEGDITKEKVIEEVEKMQDYNLKDLTLNFDRETRSFSKDIWIKPSEGEALVHFTVK